MLKIRGQKAFNGRTAREISLAPRPYLVAKAHKQKNRSCGGPEAMGSPNPAFTSLLSSLNCP